MSLFSLFRKNKQEAAAADGMFYSRADEEVPAPNSRRRRSPAREPNSGTDPVDPVLPEKKRARRRLIGALALVLAAVVGLPMILDAEPQSVTDDIDIQIPSKDRATPVAEITTDKPANDAQAANGLDATEELVTPSVKQGPSASALPAKESTALLEQKPEVQIKPTPPSESKLDSKADTKIDPKLQEAARAKALLEGKADPTSSAKPAGKFVVQVAALASKEKVDELRAKLKGAGIESFTQRIATESGDRTRIRVGPFASKEEAEKARAKILKLGLNGTLVPLES